MLARVEAGRVQLDQLRRRIPEQAPGGRREVGEPRANRKDQIRFSSESIGRSPAGDADCAQRAGMIPGEHALAGLGLRYRQAMTHREIGKHIASERVMDTATGNDQRRPGLQ
jgi:hypothetical protein